jgi:hypothetical protein
MPIIATSPIRGHEGTPLEHTRRSDGPPHPRSAYYSSVPSSYSHMSWANSVRVRLEGMLLESTWLNALLSRLDSSDWKIFYTRSSPGNQTGIVNATSSTYNSAYLPLASSSVACVPQTIQAEKPHIYSTIMDLMEPTAF